MPRGVKVCPDCGEHNGPRSITCKKCGHKFQKAVKPKKDPNKPDGRGRKICKVCGQPNGVRAAHCKNCGSPFVINKGSTIRKDLISDWTALSQGDRIRVIGGSGPYYESEGERHYTTSRGRYIVRSVTDKGINVVGDMTSKSADAGNSFLYMGPLQKSPLCNNLWRDAHKIVKG